MKYSPNSFRYLPIALIPCRPRSIASPLTSCFLQLIQPNPHDSQTSAEPYSTAQENASRNQTQTLIPDQTLTPGLHPLSLEPLHIEPKPTPSNRLADPRLRGSTYFPLEHAPLMLYRPACSSGTASQNQTNPNPEPKPDPRTHPQTPKNPHILQLSDPSS